MSDANVIRIRVDGSTTAGVHVKAEGDELKSAKVFIDGQEMFVDRTSRSQDGLGWGLHTEAGWIRGGDTYEPTLDGEPIILPPPAPHPATTAILRFFDFDHLPPDLQDISRPFHSLAHDMIERLDGPELTAGLRKLLESKDCMVRAALPERSGSDAETGASDGA